MSYRTLFTKLAAKSVTVTKEAGGSATVACNDISVASVSFSTPDLPARFLLPTTNIGSGGSNGVPIALGVTNVTGDIDWTVSDVCLWAEAGQGTGPSDYYPDLVRYIDAYTEMVLDDLTIGQTSGDAFTLTSLKFDVVADFQWPVNTGNYFYAVVARSTWREMINP